MRTFIGFIGVGIGLGLFMFVVLLTYAHQSERIYVHKIVEEDARRP